MTMKKKNILSLVLALALVAALAVGGTLAYFTDNDTEKNTFTMGHVDINLDESKDGGKTWTDDGLTYDKVLPGAEEHKQARVTVKKDSADCYVMVEVKLDGAKYSDTTKLGFKPDDFSKLYTAVEDAIKAKTPAAWKIIEMKEDKNNPNAITSLRCVYQGGTAPDVNTAHAGEVLTLFEKITIPAAFTNNTAGQTFTIDLKAYAVQSENLTYADTIWDGTFGTLTGTQVFEDYEPTKVDDAPAAPVTNPTV